MSCVNTSGCEFMSFVRCLSGLADTYLCVCVFTCVCGKYASYIHECVRPPFSLLFLYHQESES